jgi:hypothetical protein
MDLGLDLLDFEPGSRHVLRLVFRDHRERIEIFDYAPVLRRLFAVGDRAKIDTDQFLRSASNVIRNFVVLGELFKLSFRCCRYRTRLGTILSFTQAEVSRYQYCNRQNRHRKTHAGGKSTH